MKKIISIVLILLILTSSSLIASSIVPYKSWTFTQSGTEPTKTAYLPSYTITSNLESASDIFYYEGLLYVSDAVKGEIYVFENNQLVRTIGTNTLVEPTGIFLTNDLLYVADHSAKSIFIYDLAGNLQMTITEPDDLLFGDNEFIPTNVAVDPYGTIYVSCDGINEGLVKFNNKGEFIGFFAPNKAPSSIKTSIKRMLTPDEKEQEMQNLLPPLISNVYVDQNGLIYTLSPSDVGAEVKKYNVVGSSLNEVSPTTRDDQDQIVDMVVSPDGFVYTLTKNGVVQIYTSDLEPILMFGNHKPQSTSQPKNGQIFSGTAIAVDEEYNIYILDQVAKKVEVYAPTEDTLLLYEAILLDQAGKYQESAPIWEQLHAQNVYFAMPYDSLAKQAYAEGYYDTSMDYYKLSFNVFGYSTAFWESRNDFLQKYILPMFVLFIASIITFKIFKQYRKKKFKGNIITRTIVFAWLYMKNPPEGIYRMRFLHKFKMKQAIGLFITAIISIFVYLNFVSFIFNSFKNTQGLQAPNIIGITIIFSITIALVIGSNYLIISIMEGEGSLINIIKMTILSFSPIIIITPILLILSHTLSLNEVFIFDFIYGIMIIWVLIAYLVGMQQLNNFSFKETIKCIFLTLFTMFIIVIIILVGFILLKEMFVFVVEIIMEVIR